MPYCFNCGERLADRTKYCFRCGAEQPAQPGPEPRSAMKNAGDSGEKKRFWALLFLICLVFVALILVVSGMVRDDHQGGPGLFSGGSPGSQRVGAAKGRYYISAFYTESDVYELEQLEELDIEDWYIFFDENGEGLLYIFDKGPFTFTAKDGVLYMDYGEEFPYSTDGSSVTVYYTDTASFLFGG